MSVNFLNPFLRVLRICKLFDQALVPSLAWVVLAMCLKMHQLYTVQCYCKRTPCAKITFNANLPALGLYKFFADRKT